jgi:hypothetical protein
MRTPITNNHTEKNSSYNWNSWFYRVSSGQIFIKQGYSVYGYDGITDYYGTDLKIARNKILLQNKNYTFMKGLLEDEHLLNQSFSTSQARSRDPFSSTSRSSV